MSTTTLALIPLLPLLAAALTCALQNGRRAAGVAIVAMLASCGAEMCADISEAAENMRGELTVFEPRMSASTREARLSQWHESLAKALRG